MKPTECRSEIIKGKNDLTERTVQYAVRVIQFYGQICKDPAGSVIGRQLLRSATSIGANVEEAQGGQSRADFISKLSVAYKEARESSYWLRLIKESELHPNSRDLEYLTGETREIVKILSSILLSSKKPKGPTDPILNS